MPEGPECRRYAMDLAQRVSGRTLQSVELISGRFQNKSPGGLDSFIAHLPKKVVGAGVHGKFIYWILDDELSIWSTLGMTGSWSAVETKHTRVKFILNDGIVYFNDQRNFGTLKFVRGKYQLLEKLKSMGPDMLATDVSDAIFIERLRTKPDWEITSALMDQTLVAGVGNYIKSDSLWLSRISPLRKVSEISDAELTTLNRAIKQIMRESFQSGGATIKTYKKFDGSSGEYARRFLVYDQVADPDGNEVVKCTTEDDRSTYWVPKVQI